MPEISIEPDTGVVCLTNQSYNLTRSFFITFGHQLVGRDGTMLEVGSWRDESGGTHPCTTLVVVLEPRRLLEVCEVVPTRLDSKVSVWDATNVKREESGGESGGESGSGGSGGSGGGGKSDELDLYSVVSDVARSTMLEDGRVQDTEAASKKKSSVLDSAAPSNIAQKKIATTTTTTTTTPSLPFPLGGKGPYLCSQGACGCFTHFYKGTMHAVDFCCPVGTPVLAVGAGTVVDVKDTTTVGGIHSAHLFQWNSIMLRLDLEGKVKGKGEGAGEEEELKGSPVYVEYVHIASGSANVQVGDIVQTGDVICFSGDVGFCPTPHLHIQVHREMTKEAPTVPFQLMTGKRRMRSEGSVEEGGKVYVPIAGVQYDPLTGPL